ncbi:ankyrin repeat domain-containing protein 12-like [Saccostrea echinata]|uniref:ankyrin repeat domain-containing protein 12-like n=1 Tax=Saccostrea echinata TaxID=191078 RepID=UPI002A7F88F7|nr:ankyrin repeat domain-containing protein 12-like [Saccostrea echinata]
MGSLEGTFDTKLHEAVRYGDIDEVKVALQQGYDPNLIGLYQWSALHEAANNGELDILNLLLSKKGDPNKKDLLVGNTAVHYAAQEHHVECLRLLIDAGGCHDIKNSEGKSCLDLAAGECFSMLESLRVKELMVKSTEEVRKQLQEETQDQPCDQSHVSSTIGSQVAEDGLAEDIKPPAMGYLHLTFEYHSHKETLKIKVWQISDLLLPPPQTSNINSIYVKSFLMPDRKKDSKRKTEEIKVDRSDAHIKSSLSPTNKGGIQHVFSPSTFKFSKKLEYEGISASMIKEKSVQIEVCITQKYSKRSFLIGMFHMSLKEAVKKIVKEKYPLIPCVNHTIPTNMRVYCASELQITNSAKIFYSNPDFRNLSESDLSEISDRAASDPDLKKVTFAKDAITPRNVVLNIGEEQIEEQDEVMVMDVGQTARIAVPGEFVEEELNESGYSSISNVIEMTDITDDVAERSRKSAFSSVVKSVKMKTKVESLKDTSMSRTGDCSVPIEVEDLKYNEVKHKSGPRPETPTWDYYDFSMQSVEIPLDEIRSPKQGDAPVCLPMETTLGLMHSKGKKIKKPKAIREERKDIKNVPVIVVTDSESGVSRSLDKSLKIKSPREEDRIEVISSKARGSHRKKKSNKESVSVDMESFSRPNKTKDGKFLVTADIHSPSAKTSFHETSIDIGDTDSVIIDLENLETELKNVELSEKMDDSNTTSSHVVSMATDLSSNLTAMKPIPQQVFIDDSLYESGDDSSEMSDFILPFVPLTSKNDHMVSEV